MEKHNFDQLKSSRSSPLEVFLKKIIPKFFMYSKKSIHGERFKLKCTCSVTKITVSNE